MAAVAKVLECMPQMVAMCDGTGRIKHANKKWEKFREGKKEEKWMSMVHPLDQYETKAKWEEHVKSADGSSFEITHRLRNGEGEYKWHRSSSSRYDDEGTDYLVTCIDVHTEITLSQTSFSREEAFERRIIHNADPILTVNADDKGTIMRINNAVTTHFQYSPEELIGKPCTILMEDRTGIRHVGEKGYFSKFKRSLTATGQTTSVGFSNRQIQVKRKDGKFVPVSFVVDSYIQGNVHIFIVILRPLTPDISVQHEINKSKDAFLSTISHELRTPLFGLLGTISLLHTQIVDQTTLDDVTQMEMNVMSLLSIVNNMVDFYLLKQLNAQPVYLPFDASKLVADICDRMSGFTHNGVDFTYETDAPALLVSDPNFIEHVLVNLLSNALRFTHSGKVQVKVFLTDPSKAEEAAITLLPGQGILQLTVTDTGIGIEPEFYPQLFQPFTQIDTSDQRAYKGVGLGLAITKSVADMLGGAVSFKSSPGHGSEFYVLVPVELIQVPNDPPSRQPSPIPNLDMFDLAPHPGQPRKRRLSSPLLTQFLHPEESAGSPTRYKPSSLPLSSSLPSSALPSSSLGSSSHPLSSLPLSSLPTIYSPLQAPACPFAAAMGAGAVSPHALTPTAELLSQVFLTADPPAAAQSPAKAPPKLRKYPSSPSLSTLPDQPFTTPSSSSSSSSTSSSLSPADASKLPQKARDANSQQIGALNKRVLVIEDNSMNQLVIKRMLQRLECDVVLAKHGAEALEILFDTESEKYVGYKKFDTVLVDCQMPVMTGYQVTEHIRNWETLQRDAPHMLVLALSASISAENEAKCIASGMDGFIAKPVTVSMLFHYLTSYYSLVNMQTPSQVQ